MSIVWPCPLDVDAYVERGREIESPRPTCRSVLVRPVSRNTFDPWIRAYRQHGLGGLRDRPRSDQGSVRRYEMLIEAAVKLRLEHPARSAAHIAEILFARHGVRIPERTLREQLQKRGLTRAELLRDQRSFGRYEAAEPNERWIADVLVGPFVPHPRAPGSQRARLFLIVDDHSRLVVHGRWVGNETLRASQEVLHAAILRRGVDVGSGAVQIDQRLDRKAVSQVMVVPTSAQARLCRPLRYADPETESRLSELEGS